MFIIKGAALICGTACLLPVSLIGTQPIIDEEVPGHCMIPCGIFDDQARFTELSEHITTIEKSMVKIAELQADPAKNANQLIRWVNNKETHANEFVHILTEYFLQQRIKLAEAESNAKSYAAKIASVHKMMVLCMKSKQTIDTGHTKALAEELHNFLHLYDPNHKH